jgi:CRISPR/Cas system-associated protein Csx1
MFSKKNEDFQESLPLNVRFQTLMQMQKKKKKKKKKRKKKQRLEKRIKVKRKENKIKYIIYTITYLPGNGAKNLTRSKS